MKKFLAVNFEEKDTIKEKGGKWDNDEKLWYIDDENSELEKFELIELYVPYEDKDEVRENGGIWNSQKKKWVIPKFLKTKFKQYLKSQKTYVNVDYENKDKIKENGGRWDSEKKMWFFEKKIPDDIKHLIKENKLLRYVLKD